MTHSELAKKIADAIFDVIETKRRIIKDDLVETVDRVLAKRDTLAPGVGAYAYTEIGMTGLPNDGSLVVKRDGAIYTHPHYYSTNADTMRPLVSDVLALNVGQSITATYQEVQESWGALGHHLSDKGKWMADIHSNDQLVTITRLAGSALLASKAEG